VVAASGSIVEPLGSAGAAAPVGATREDQLAVEGLERGDEAAEVLGGRIASRLEAEVADARRRCEERGVDADRLRGAVIEAESLLETPSAWLLGNEAHGLPSEALSRADAVVSIPIYGKAESLNVAAAAAVAFWAVRGEG